MRFATKIGLSAAAAALVIGPLLGAAVFFKARAVLQEHIIHEQVQVARGVMREIDTAMHHAYQDVSTIAADELLAGFFENPDDSARKSMVAEELEERETLTGPWDALTVFDASGRAVFAPKPLGNEAAISAYVTSEPAFRRALKGEIYYSDRLVRRRTGIPVVIFAAPVYGNDDRRKVVGVVIAHYRWAEVQGILDRVDPAAWVHLLNREGSIIAKRSNDPFNQVFMSSMKQVDAGDAKSGYVIASGHTHGEEETLKVETAQSGVQDYHGSGWRLLLEQPSDKVFAPIRKMAMETTLLVFGVLLVVAVLFVILGRRFLRPLAELVEGVRQVEQGHLDHKVVVRSNDEFGALADSFNVMVSKLREAQEELVRKGKLAMLGQVASSVGHELRNPLGVMNNAVYFLQSMLDEADDSVKEYLGIIRDEIARSERIVAELMNAVSTRPPDLAAHGVAYLVAEVLHKSALPSSVTITLDIPETLPAVRVDAIQLQQVLENLVTNAVDAMPEGGVLEFSAAESEGGTAVALDVRDSGNGIAPENMARLFQPLFTTKARGIGLGLVVAKNLIEANGGKIEVQSKPGKGTLVTITLPTAPERDISI
ncbi:MAG: ATP-binding protein [Sulfuricella sp.]